MIKTKTVEVKTHTTKIIEAKCDWCGEKVKDDTLQVSGYGQLSIHFGWDSEYDDDRWDGEICDRCFEKYLKPKMRLKK